MWKGFSFSINRSNSSKSINYFNKKQLNFLFLNNNLKIFRQFQSSDSKHKQSFNYIPYFYITRYKKIMFMFLAASPMFLFLKNVYFGLTEEHGVSNFIKALKNTDFQSLACLVVPSNIFTNIFYHISSLENPKFLSQIFVRLYVKIYSVNLQEAERTKAIEYKSIQDLFTRTLNKDARPFDANSEFISPCDGKLISFGKINNSQPENFTFQYVKGQKVLLSELLSIPLNETDVFKNIKLENSLYYMIIYLAPHNYHWFHSPTEWIINKVKRVSGSTYCVSPKYLKMVPAYTCKNERVIIEGSWKHGIFHMIPIAALNVGGIRLPLLQELKDVVSLKWKEDSYIINETKKKSETVGNFLIGSTIVILYEAPSNAEHKIKEGDDLQLGQTFL